MKKILLLLLVFGQFAIAQNNSQKEDKKQEKNQTQTKSKSNSSSQDSKFRIGADLQLNYGLAKEYTGMGYGVGVNGEFFLTTNWALTAEIGYNMFGKHETEYKYLIYNPTLNVTSDGTATFAYKTSVTNFGLGVNYYFSDVNAGGMGFYVGLGLNRYSVTLKADATDKGVKATGQPGFTGPTSPYESVINFDSSTASAIGFMPRVGLDFPLSGKLHIFGELGYMMSRVELSNSVLATLNTMMVTGNSFEHENQILNAINLKVGIKYSL